MKIVDLRCAVIGRHPIVRIVTDEGLYGLGEVEHTKGYLKPWILHFREVLLGSDPTDVERCMLKIRQRGSFKPYGAAVSAIEHALWDIAGKAAGVPAYKLLGGKVRDRVRVYNGSVRKKRPSDNPEDFAAQVKWMMEQPEKFFMIKQGIGFHSTMKTSVDGFHYGIGDTSGFHGAMTQGAISPRGISHMLECVAAMKEVMGESVSLALDCGPGWMLPDAIRFAKAVEKYNIAWLEDMLTGDYVPWVNPQAYRELTTATSTPIHTGEQIYLRHNFKELIETQAVRVIGPDPADIGGIAELKWVAEHAYMHQILMAPHGTANGLLGLGALINVCATLPANFVAFEYPSASDTWWSDLVTGLPNPIVTDSLIDVLEAPGLGVDINAEAARPYLKEEDAGFFDEPPPR
ncbi:MULTISPECIES: mandelate racemase/muconate lactonizing enzyme family protein [Rhizobium/Agrobacterium group]|uniref:mandelate racemase/muconate lactonizing enzyme family protein n=1 Tax=Rhizobium/Agrobacterium group TaxID=227290 RepID=UPI0015739EFA|nr:MULTISPECIES: mandelate racemase/muconate lactonizing enzyme family protein [Rhizobium/Agrobacterium group]NTA83825.1 mandelate racemase/muconate lactonizing enzyme family protein [Agrobacterium tumefaciens]NTF96069.1 mandelate racemase/muconate lactonizing enzyme family protein [Rhizobium rhizogenes]